MRRARACQPPTPAYPHAVCAAADSIEQYLEKGFSYARTGNPTVTTLENKIAGLESGYGAACFGTGTAGPVAMSAPPPPSGSGCRLSVGSPPPIFSGWRCVLSGFFTVGLGPEPSDQPSFLLP